jgi:hypothetical protein
LPQRAPLGPAVGLLAALDIPILFGFSVARYQDPQQPVLKEG